MRHYFESAGVEELLTDQQKAVLASIVEPLTFWDVLRVETSGCPAPIRLHCLGVETGLIIHPHQIVEQFRHRIIAELQITVEAPPSTKASGGGDCRPQTASHLTLGS